MVREDLRGSVPEYLDRAAVTPWRNVDLSSFPSPSAHANPDGTCSVTVHPFSGGRDHHPNLPEPFVWYDLHVTRLPSADGGGKRTMFHGKSSQDPHARVLVTHSRMGMRVLDGEPVTVDFPADLQAEVARRGSRGLMFEVRGRTAKGVSVSKTAYLPDGAGPPLVKTNLISRPRLRWADNVTETEVAVGFDPWHLGFRQYVVLTAFGGGKQGAAPSWSSDLSDSGNVPSKLTVPKDAVGTIRIVGFNSVGESTFVDMFWPDPEARKEREKYLESLKGKGKVADDNAGFGVAKPSRKDRSQKLDSSDSSGSSTSGSSSGSSTYSSGSSSSSSSSNTSSSSSSSSSS